jgi:hypothetical protein
VKLPWLLITAAVACASPAQARSFGEFKIGSWSGAANTDEKGEFNHCGAFTHLRDGTMVSFAVGRNFTWSVGFNNRRWKFREGDLVPVMFGVDDMTPVQMDARAYMRNGIEIGLGERADLFRQFTSGRRLKVLGAPKPIDFKLTGTERILPRLLACALFKGKTAGAIPARDPAADIPNYTARQMRSDTAMVVEATTLAANLLSAAGITGYRLLGPKEEPGLKGDARWIMPGEGIGVVQVRPDMTPEVQLSLGRVLIGEDARSCKGTFMSATLPADEKAGSGRVFTTCDDGKRILTSYYFTMPRRAGGAYVVATTSYEARAAAPRSKEIDATFRHAAYGIMEGGGGVLSR